MATISFSAEGTALNAFRDALRIRHLSCTRQQIRNGIFYAHTKLRYWYGISAAAAEFDVRLSMIQKQGLYFRLYPYRLRLIGICIGVLCAGAFFYWNASCIHSIEIYGNTTVSDTEILAALDSLGIRPGTPYREIAFTAAEQQLRLAVSDIEWIAMRHSGGRLVVDLREETPPPSIRHDRIPTNYIATVSAQITKLEVLGGHALAARGDAVKPGDVIISGVVQDPNGVTRFYHADGRVEGIYEYDFECYQPFCEEITVNGVQSSQAFLDVFGKRIPLSVGFSPPPEPFIYTEESKPLMLFGTPAPFSIIRCHYTEQLPMITAYSPEETDALLLERVSRFEQNFHNDDKIISKEIVMSENDLGKLLKIHYVFEGVVGKTSEIFVKVS